MSSNKGSHGYCLKWKYHPQNLLQMFNQLLLNENFTDVVLVCEGKAIKCHKVVLASCSKYFEEIFCQFPQQNSTLVILTDLKYADLHALVDFMYNGEINVEQSQLQALLKAAESLQVKGLADITGGGGANAAVTGNNKDDQVEFMGGGGGDTGGEDSMPPSPPGVCMEGTSDGSLQESATTGVPSKRKRGRPPTLSMDSSMAGQTPILTETSQFDDFPPASLLDSHFVLPRSRKSNNGNKRKMALEPGDFDQNDDEDNDDMDQNREDDDVTEDDIANVVKMTEYIEKGGSRPQFWEEPTTRKIMNAIRSKKMEMKSAAEILGVSYSTLYSRYRELHGYLKMPHTQDTNFNYYQVLNLLRAGQITLSDAAKRLNIHEKTLGAYLSSTITPKKPRVTITPSTSSNNDLQSYGMNLLEQVTLQGNQISNVLEKQHLNYDDDDEDSNSDHNTMPAPLQLDTKTDGDQGDGWSR